MECVSTNMDGDRKRVEHACHATPDRVFVRLVLPLMARLMLLFLIYLAARYFEKAKLRSPPAPLEQLTVGLGRFAAGADDYSCTDDVCPIILPKRVVVAHGG